MVIGLRRMYTTAIVMLPILSQYESGIPKLSLGDLMLLLATLLVFFYWGMNVHALRIDTRSTIANPFLWFAIYIICGSMLSSLTQNYVSMSDIVGSSMRYVFYIFCACVISAAFFDWDYFMPMYRNLVIFATTFLMIQTLLFHWKGYVLFGTIPGLGVNNPFYDQDAIRRGYSNFYRPASIFLEPGYYAQFVLPYFAYTLFSKNESHKYVRAMILTTGCILSTSGQGIAISFLIWTVHFAKSIFNRKLHTIDLRIIIVGIIALVMILPITRTEIMQNSLKRLFSGPSASSYSRIFRGFAVYEQLKPIHKVIGVGYGHKGVYMSHENTATDHFGDDLYGEYMNSIAGILVSLGLVGFLLMSWIFVFLWRKTRKFHRICTYILILLSAVSAHFTGPGIVFYLSIILSGDVHHNHIKENIVSVS